MCKVVVTVLLLTATSVVAAAQPGLTSPLVPSSDDHDPEHYIQLDGAVGISEGAMFAAPALEVGKRLANHTVWLHGLVMAGPAGEIDSAGSTGSVMQARVGLELRGCIAANLACGILGLDAGLSRIAYTSHDDSADEAGLAVYGRTGLDVGGDHVRLRATVELGGGGAGLLGGLACQW